MVFYVSPSAIASARIPRDPSATRPRHAILAKLWIDPPERGLGAASAALRLIDPELRTRGVRALHLQVRPDNRRSRSISAPASWRRRAW